ncbi:MAG: sulfotransferase [Flavobacteriales bacterium]|nr:sulfotransferase [Flavobacteriales bacterium]
MERSPQFLHIGYSKSASTWLQKLLAKEEGLYFKYKSYFFYPYRSAVYDKGVEHYRSLFENAPENKIIIESQEHIILPFIHPDREVKIASTNLEMVQKISERIKSVIPDVKIILIIRDQEKMVRSRYIQYLVQGGTLDAHTFLERTFLNDNYLEYLDYRYDQVLDVLNNVFGAKNVLMLSQEGIAKEPDTFVKKLSKFMGYQLSFTSESAGKKKNSGASYSTLLKIRRLNRMFVKELNTYNTKTKTRIIPYFLWFFIGRSLIRLDRMFVKDKNLQQLFLPEDVAVIKDTFRASNRRLAELTDLPIKKYNYPV